MPASRTAKSPACEDGKRSATKSSKVPVNPGSPGHVGHVAFARVTDVWNSRTCERSEASRSTLTSMAPVLPFSAPPWIVTLTSAHSPSRRSPTASSPSLVGENRTRS